MRTTLDIDDDLLLATKELARRERRTAGEVVSRLLRAALTQRPVEADRIAEPAPAHGFRPLPANGQIVTNEWVNRLRDEEGI